MQLVIMLGIIAVLSGALAGVLVVFLARIALHNPARATPWRLKPGAPDWARRTGLKDAVERQP